MTNETTSKPRPSSEQETAVEMCCDLTNTIVGVTGAAGTGKTFVLGEVYKELRGMKKKVTLCAPTGRAAKRIQELTGIQAKTIHKVLEFPQPDEYDDEPNEPRRDQRTPLEEDVLICDESSMISPTLYRQIMNALGKHCVVRFFGDNNQLPPVEDGKPPFIEVLQKYPHVELSFNFRSDDAIVMNAQRILRASIPQRNSRFEIIYNEDPIRAMLEFVKGQDVFRDADHQIITPGRKGKHGTMKINPYLQARFNPRGDMLYLDRYDDEETQLGIRGGDKFLWIKNDYKLHLFNGEIGKVDWVDEEGGELSITTPEKSLLVPARLKTFSPYHQTVINYDPRKALELGYAITTHKAQGSEFETVIYCISPSQMYLLNRRNFYTAVTRARRNVIMITSRKAMNYAMRAARV